MPTPATATAPRTFTTARLLAAALAAATLTQSAAAQTYTWDDTTGDNLWFTDGNWDIAGVPNVPGESAVVGSPAPTFLNGNVNIDSLTVTAAGDLTVNSGFNLDLVTTGFLTNAGNITAQNNTDLVFVNAVNNSGTISINSTGSLTDIELRADSTLTGGGTITLSGANAGVNDNSTFINVLTITDQTIQGEGRFGQNTIAVTNTAGNLIDANVNGGALTLDPANVLGGFGFTNGGTIQASGGGTLLLTGSGGGDFDNTGGLIQALAGSEVQFTTNSDITGGTIQSVGTGVVRVNTGQNAFFSDLTLDGNIVSDNNTDFGVAGNINLLGNLNVNSTGSLTDLELQADTTFTGGGLIVLSGDNAGVNDATTSVFTLTLNDDTNLVGQGRVGQNTIAIVNNAIIAANVLGEDLTLDPADGAAEFDNNGILRASIGNLVLTGSGGGEFDNTGGIIESIAAEGEVQLTTEASITGGTLRTTNGGVIRANANQNVFLTDLTNEGNFVADNNTDLGIAGTINNTGSIAINSTGSFTDLEIQEGGATLTGGGTVTLSGPNAGINDATTTVNVLTVDDQTIEGEGRFGQNAIAVVNNGLIDANVDGGSLTLDPVASAFAFDNNATLRASNGGTLVLTGNGGGEFDNAGGTIEALADSEVQLTTNASVTGGTLDTVGNGVIRNNANQIAFLADLTNAGNFVADNNTDTRISGTINNTGNIAINSTGSFTDLEIQEGGATLTGGGTVILSGGNAGINDNSTTVNVLTVDDQTIEGEGRFGQNTIAVVNGADGLIDANVSTGTLTLDPANGAGSDDFDNAGTLRASGGGTLTLTGSGGGSFDNTGTIEALAGSTVQTITGAVINQIDDSDDSITGGTFRAINGTLNLAPSASFDLTVNDGATLEFSGTAADTNLFDDASSSPGDLISDNFATNAGTLILRDGVSLTSNVDPFDNAGTLIVGSGSRFDLIGGTLNNTVDTGTARISGEGTLEAFVTNGFSGVIAPGDTDTAAGTLTIAGDLTLTGGSGPDGIEIDIFGSNDNDALTIGGGLNLDGSLFVDLASSFNPADGEQFLIATALPGLISGDFFAINDNSALYNFSSVIDSDNGNVFLEAEFIPEPTTVTLLGLGLGGLLLRRRRA